MCVCIDKSLEEYTPNVKKSVPPEGRTMGGKNFLFFSFVLPNMFYNENVSVLFMQLTSYFVTFFFFFGGMGLTPGLSLYLQSRHSTT
jgi:hypothetical protein